MSRRMRPSHLRRVVAGAAIMEADHVVHEGVEHHMQRVLRYVRAAGFDSRVPWCAAWVAYVVSLCAAEWDLPNPLEGVKLAALVRSYHQWAEENRLMATPGAVEAGDLALFRFSSADWNHIGIVIHPPDGDGRFGTVEGNTSPGIGATDADRERDGGGVWRRGRQHGNSYPVQFVRWAL